MKVLFNDSGAAAAMFNHSQPKPRWIERTVDKVVKTGKRKRYWIGGIAYDQQFVKELANRGADAGG